MPTVSFTTHLQRHIGCPATSVAGGTVREVLDAVFVSNPRARGYVLDDQGAVRKHVAVFVNGALIADRTSLTDPVRSDDRIFVMQALSGG